MIDLMAEYGRRYRVTMDPTWEVERNRQDEDKPWFYEIVGKNGMIYPHAHGWVAMETTVKIGARVLREHASLRILRSSSEGPTFGIPDIYTSQFFRYIRPRLRRQLTPEQRKAASERLQAYKFRARNVQQGAEIPTIVPEPVQ